MRSRTMFAHRIGRSTASAICLLIAACTSGSDGSGAAPVAGTTAFVELGEAGIFEVSAGIPARAETSITLFERPPSDEPLGALLRLPPEAVVVRESPSAKSAVTASAEEAKAGPSGVVKLRVILGSNGFKPFFDPREDLGVITVSLSNGAVTSVQSAKPIPSAALQKVLSGFFKVGMEVLADFDGQVEFKSFNVDFGMTADDPRAPTDRRACCFARNGPPQCLDIGFIDAVRTPDDCRDRLSGVPLGVGTSCGELPCDLPEACCLRSGDCAPTPPLECRDRGGKPQDAGIQCAAVECPSDTRDCSPNGECNVMCPDVEPDPDCTNDALCRAKEFCCPTDLVCDIRRCNEPDLNCTNDVLCDLRQGCCRDDDVCDTAADGIQCPQMDQDCSNCPARSDETDEVCIRGCTPADPDCLGSDACPEDNRCDRDCPGEDADCTRCEADAFGSCVADCEPPDPDCLVETNITAEGTASASSTFQDDSTYLPFRATDRNVGSNWFSDGKGGGGPDADSELFTWLRNLSGDTSITRIETDPETFPDGAFGFSIVEVRVWSSANEVVFFSGPLTMTASRVDLDVSVPDGTRGNRVVLTLINHEDPSCGGFSEFRVFGLRD